MKAPGNKEKASCRVEWKDLLAFCIALYQILAPQLLATMAAVGIIAFLLLRFWLK
ncbi:MAG: hypothetical protein WBK48_06405 [Dethiobacteria bacterium]|jgi:hypothetical protein|nr:hypothetical protein [Bacillota bacterium]HOP69483.1 hypothetical protein [Bacillota bacterium]HPT34409.1 hypothetical protein [Bacillota bacterium]HPZ64596.1 hypothetical protein [Bacillota bacterium]HQD06233.1 hypothetical protein [Bacillota bacterium]